MIAGIPTTEYQPHLRDGYEVEQVISADTLEAAIHPEAMVEALLDICRRALAEKVGSRRSFAAWTYVMERDLELFDDRPPTRVLVVRAFCPRWDSDPVAADA